MKLKWLFILLLFSCSKEQMDDCITSAGPEHTIERQIVGFSTLECSDKIEIVLIQDVQQYVKITGPRNLLGQIKTEITDDVLKVSNTSTCDFVRSFKHKITVEIHCKTLEAIRLGGAAELRTEGLLQLNQLHILHQALSDVSLDIHIESLIIQTYNSAKLTLTGVAGTLRGSIEDVSDLDARDLDCEEVLLDSHTPLDCYINATKIIFVKIYNKGNIYYMSEPSNYKDLNVRKGEGNLILLQ